MNNINIKGYGAYVPENVVTNNDLEKIVETSDEWISKRTGIKERRISTGEDTSVLASKAASLALERANIKAEDVDLIIVGTITPDMCTPSTACIVQKLIGAKNAMAFDINAACSGFMYSMQIAFSMMQNDNSMKKAIVIGAEILSKIVNWQDRSTCVLFGDGAGAVVLEKEESNEEKLRIFKSISKGEQGDSLTCGAFDVRNPYISNGEEKNKKIYMEGKKIFKFAVESIENSIKYLLEKSNSSIEDIDYIVLHQVNERIVNFASQKLDIDRHKFYLNLDRYGNTSSASIPIALNEMYEKNLLKSGNKVMMIGFGGGLTVGSCIIEL